MQFPFWLPGCLLLSFCCLLAATTASQEQEWRVESGEWRVESGEPQPESQLTKNRNSRSTGGSYSTIWQPYRYPVYSKPIPKHTHHHYLETNKNNHSVYPCGCGENGKNGENGNGNCNLKINYFGSNITNINVDINIVQQHLITVMKNLNIFFLQIGEGIIITDQTPIPPTNGNGSTAPTMPPGMCPMIWKHGCPNSCTDMSKKPTPPASTVPVCSGVSYIKCPLLVAGAIATCAVAIGATVAVTVATTTGTLTIPAAVLVALQCLGGAAGLLGDDCVQCFVLFVCNFGIGIQAKLIIQVLGLDDIDAGDVIETCKVGFYAFLKQNLGK